MITSRRGGCWHFLRVFNSWLIPTIFSPFFTLIPSFSLQQGISGCLLGLDVLVVLWQAPGGPCSGHSEVEAQSITCPLSHPHHTWLLVDCHSPGAGLE